MDVFRREKADDLFQHPLDEFEGRLLADAEHPVVDIPGLAHLVLFARAAEPRIGGQRAHGMSGEFDLGDHRDKTLRGVVHDVADLVLRIVTAIGRFVELAVFVVLAARVAADQRTAAYGTHLGQFRVFLNLDTPSLVVGQVPVEHVELMQGHDIERLLHFVDREEMAADVEHHAPVAQARFVLDRHDGQLHGPHVGRTVSRSGDQLAEGLHRIERPGCAPGNNLRTPGRNLQAVAIRRHRRVARDIQRPVEGHVGMPHPQPFARLSSPDSSTASVEAVSKKVPCPFATRSGSGTTATSSSAGITLPQPQRAAQRTTRGISLFISGLF